VQALKDLPVNLLLKTWLTEADAARYSDLYKNQQEMNKIHKDIENAYILDPKTSIMYCLGISDVFVTDESSILFESLLLNVPSVSVSDWPMRTNNQRCPRMPDAPYEFVHKTSKANLKNTISELLQNPSKNKKILEKHRLDNFSFIGCSSSAIVDLLESLLLGSSVENQPLSPLCKELKYLKYSRPLLKTVRKNIFARLSRKIYVSLMR
jgi:hypothetical protein